MGGTRAEEGDPPPHPHKGGGVPNGMLVVYEFFLLQRECS